MIKTNSAIENLPGQWVTTPCDDDNGNLIMVSGRVDVTKFKSNPRFKYRMVITWDYSDISVGMPPEVIGELMGEAQDLIVEDLHKDPVAVLTGIYTGAGKREWVFYTASVAILSRKINEDWATLPLLPVTLEAFEDSNWEEYDEMSQCLLQ